MAKAYYLNEDDRRLIQEFLTRFRGRRINTPPNSWEEDQDFGAANTYVALTPYGGIPALALAGAGAGAGDQPGSATCSVYQVVNGVMRALPGGLSKTVYNLTETPIAGDIWVLITRDRFCQSDKWFVVTGGGGGGSNLVVRFEVASTGSGISDMICQILAVPSGMTLAQMPGQIGLLSGLIHVCDASGCFFNAPGQTLLGAQGWAQYMQPLTVTQCQEYPPLSSEWEVINLCCLGAGGCP